MVLLIFPGFIGMIVCAILLLIKAITKKPKKKTGIAFLLCLAMCVVAIASVDEEPESTETNPTTVQVTEAIESTEVTESVTEPETEAPTEAVTEEATLSSADAAELVMAMIELTVAEQFDYYKVEGDETGITLSVATDGVATEVTAAKIAGYDENYESWVVAKDNFTNLCKVIYDSAVEFGMENPAISLLVLNDQNHDNVLLMVMNGVVVYDVMAE